jgi:hypothetical protein
MNPDLKSVKCGKNSLNPFVCEYQDREYEVAFQSADGGEANVMCAIIGITGVLLALSDCAGIPTFRMFRFDSGSAPGQEFCPPRSALAPCVCACYYCEDW